MDKPDHSVVPPNLDQNQLNQANEDSKAQVKQNG